MKRIIAALLLLAMVFTIVPLPQATAQGAEQSYLVMANSNRLPNGLEARITAAGGTITRVVPEIGLVVVSSSDPNFAASAAAISGVRSAIPNLSVQWLDPDRQMIAEYENPPFSGEDDFFFDLQWGHDSVNAPEAWNAGVRGAGVRVAVLDTGFDLDHPDLAPNINLALSENFVPGETLQYALPDTFSHGTHTAGTIGAADNAFGVIGVAPEVELVLVKVLGDEGSGDFAGVFEGIVHAASVDADVINMSLGASIPQRGIPGDITAREVAELRVLNNRAVTYAYQQGTTVITSAGNAARDGDHDADMVVFPADASHAITISATAPVGWATDPGNIFLDNLASYSNYGQSLIDFSAPGGDSVYPGNEACLIAGLVRPCWVFDLVFSTGNNGWYWSAGTSMAAPHAAGVAALIISENGGSMNPAHVERELRRRAEDLGKPGNDDAYGAGAIRSGY